MSWMMQIQEGYITFERVDLAGRKSMTVIVEKCDVMVTENGNSETYGNCDPDKLVELTEKYEGIQTKPLTQDTKEDKQDVVVNNEDDGSPD